MCVCVCVPPVHENLPVSFGGDGKPRDGAVVQSLVGAAQQELAVRLSTATRLPVGRQRRMPSVDNHSSQRLTQISTC